MLEIQGLTHSFGGLRAVEDFSLAVAPGEIVGLIGPNGAGKTTVFNLVTGVYRPDRGRVAIDGRALTGRRPHRVTRAGVARTFQNIRIFPALTVADNLKVAAHHRRPYGLARALTAGPAFARAERALEAEALELLAIFGLADQAYQNAGGLPYGEQRRLELARALATRPRYLLLDEPAAGMNLSEAARLMETILDLRHRFALGILLIEHQMPVVMGCCERIQVMNFGRTIARGEPGQIQADPQVIEAYLGSESGARGR